METRYFKAKSFTKAIEYMHQGGDVFISFDGDEWEQTSLAVEDLEADPFITETDSEGNLTDR